MFPVCRTPPRSDLFDAPERSRLIVVSLFPKAVRKTNGNSTGLMERSQAPKQLLRSRPRSYPYACPRPFGPVLLAARFVSIYKDVPTRPDKPRTSTSTKPADVRTASC